ncbi:MAG: hypothetical protein A2V86_08835 [Deltaproteobacteria bacterium RBG_16_49_23]|nr:MAG: hypothetical protein A2V86_08835 [Deltaproteobacteria bacterium RBG_16_49_23]
MKIKNRESLVATGDIAGRQVVLEILETALQTLDSYQVIRNLLRLDGNILRIGNQKWNLQEKRRLFVVGAGKACNSMAKAVEDTLGNRITKGIVIVKQIDGAGSLHRIELAVGGHPLPNEEGLLASRRILDLVNDAGPGDLFIGLISGGSSALMSCPVPGITLEDEMKVTAELLRSGARILEINAVRRHISAANGGRLAQKIEAKGAEMINLIISDSVGSKPTIDPDQPAKFFGTPVAADSTTLQDARNVLKKYDLLPLIPPSIVEFLHNPNPAHETPKTLGNCIHHFVLQKPADACEAAKRAVDRMGLDGLILTTHLEGESREGGIFLAAVAKETALNHRPLAPPCVLIAGGETTTRVDGPCGMGGPSQELALSFALETAGLEGFCIGAIDTDGTDGPSEIAGGMTDGTTVARAHRKGVNAYEQLRAHNSSAVLRMVGDEIVTGNTGTNVCDLNVIYIGPKS